MVSEKIKVLVVIYLFIMFLLTFGYIPLREPINKYIAEKRKMISGKLKRLKSKANL